MQKIDDLLQLGLAFVHSRDIGKGNAGLFLHVDLGLGFANIHEAAAKTLFIAKFFDDKKPYAEKDKGRKNPGQQRHEKLALVHLGKGNIIL